MTCHGFFQSNQSFFLWKVKLDKKVFNVKTKLKYYRNYCVQFNEQTLTMKKLASNEAYRNFFVDIKQKIQQAQFRATVTVNQQLLVLYWEIGTEIIQRQKKSNWGDKILEQLSTDLKKTFPDMKGFSTRNLKYMRRFARTYPDFEIGQQPVAQISWSHNILLMQKCSDEKEQLFYAQKALQNGWSRNIMVH